MKKDSKKDIYRLSKKKISRAKKKHFCPGVKYGKGVFSVT